MMGSSRVIVPPALTTARSVERAPLTMTPTVPCTVRNAGSTTAAGPRGGGPPAGAATGHARGAAAAGLRGGVLAAGAVTAHDKAAAKIATTAELRRVSVNAMSVTPF